MPDLAVEYTEYGSPAVLHVVEIPTPEPGPHEVRIEVRAAGVNPVDAKVRAGKRATGPIPGPQRLGSDAGGVVESVGAEVDGLEVGDAVIARGLKGAYATRVVAPASQLTRKPDAMSFEEAAAVGVPVGTAYQILRSAGTTAGDVVLIHAGSGAVGQAAIQFARAWGARVIATASERNHDRLRELGAEPIVYGDGLLDRVRRLAPEGVDVSLECAGTREAIEVSVEVTKDRRRVVEIVNMDWRDEFGVLGFTSSKPGYLGPAEIALRAEAVGAVVEQFESTGFQLEIGHAFPLSEARAAHEAIEAGTYRGKLVLVP